MKQGLNRRQFLAAGTAAAAGALAVPARAVPVKGPAKWDLSTDVVIIGAGGAGLGAAVTAVKDTSLKVIVLEKQPIVGGSSTICGGAWAVAGTEDQAAKGIKDSPELFFQDMMKTGKGRNNPELVKAYIATGKVFYDFITKELGVKRIGLSAVAGMSVPRAHEFHPSDVVQALYNYVKERKVNIMMNTAAERLVWDAQNECIGGVRAKRNGKTIFIQAKKAVLIASGGFARNPKLLEKFVPPMAKADAEGGLGNTGDGMLMAQAYGADVLDTQYIKATYGYRLDKSYGPQTCHAYYGGAILINKDCKRFVNESLSYKLLADASLEQPGALSYEVFDEPVRQRRMKARFVEKGLLEPLNDGKEVPYCFRGNTIEEVAKKAGLDPKAVKETVDRYNANVAKGVDPDFGRTSLTSGFGKPEKIETAPFFIYPAKPRLIATYCGLKIDPRARVIDVYGEPIPHLYAAGEVTGGVHGAAYMSGTAWSKAYGFGRLAILDIAGKQP